MKPKTRLSRAPRVLCRRHPYAMRCIAWSVAAAFAGGASANPVAPSVAAGSASFQTSGQTLTVTNAPGTIINWRSFSIGAGELTHFKQQSASSAVLNRVIGNDGSSILGTLSSNGRVFLVNPHGIVFGAGSRVDTAGFIASTLNMSDSDFLQGKLNFVGGGAGVLRNEGAIRASGDIMLVGPRIENAGLIRSENGAVLLAAGQKLTITSPDSQGVKFEVQAPTDSALNVGVIEARTAVAMFAGTLRHSGDIRAGAATFDDGGRVVLSAQTDAVVEKNATITASGTQGGTVHVLGNRVGVFDAATLDASGEAGGGTILVGGDYQGKNPDIRNASQTIVGKDVVLNADALAAGDGGKVVVWSDRTTRFAGRISARGGSQSGNGGFVEVSGKRLLDFTGHVDTRAPKGRAGTLLLDPTNIQIVAGGTALPDTDPPPLGSNTFQETGSNDGVVNPVSQIAAPLIALLLTDGNVTITTASTAVGPAGDITFAAPFNFSHGINDDRTLTLIANNNVNINAPIFDITPNAGERLNLTINTGGATNIGALINLGGGTFNAVTGGGSGIVNIGPTAPLGMELNDPLFANTLNVNKPGVIVSTSTVNVGTLNLNTGTLSLVQAPFSANTINLALGTRLATNGESLAIAAGGRLSGRGTLDLAGTGTLVNAGVVEPGVGVLAADGVGALTIIGDFLQTTGQTNIRLAGPGAFGALAVSGVATIGGTLDVKVLPGFNAPAGSLFNVLTFLPGSSVASGAPSLPAIPRFTTVTSPGLFQLLQLTNVRRPGLNDVNTNSLLSLGDQSLLVFTPQGVKIADKNDAAQVCL